MPGPMLLTTSPSTSTDALATRCSTQRMAAAAAAGARRSGPRRRRGGRLRGARPALCRPVGAALRSRVKCGARVCSRRAAAAAGDLSPPLPA